MPDIWNNSKQREVRVYSRLNANLVPSWTALVRREVEKELGRDTEERLGWRNKIPSPPPPLTLPCDELGQQAFH